MESEKVKEIKKALENNANYEHHNKLSYIDDYKCKTVAYADILILINELEKENKEQLKQFAERLKENFNDTEYRAKTKRKTISVEELKAQMDWILHEVVIKNIDETLKEFVGVEG